MPKKVLTLEEARKAAYAAVAAHDHDMKTNPNYRAVVEKQDARRHAKAVKEGRNPLAISYTVEIAVDHHEAEQFVTWLQKQGHTANIGATTNSYINGRPTGGQTADIMRGLWEAYCNA